MIDNQNYPMEQILHRFVEEIQGRVTQIDGKNTYIEFEIDGKPIKERIIRTWKLKRIHADHKGALIGLGIDKNNKIKLRNLEKEGTPTWRDKYPDKDLEKFDLMKKAALPQKFSKL